MKQLKNWDNKTWLSSNKYILSFYKFLKTKIKINKKTSILDIGCGRANIIAFLQKRHKFQNKPIGIDIVKSKNTKKNIIFKKTRITQISQNKKSFESRINQLQRTHERISRELINRKSHLESLESQRKLVRDNYAEPQMDRIANELTLVNEQIVEQDKKLEPIQNELKEKQKHLAELMAHDTKVTGEKKNLQHTCSSMNQEKYHLEVDMRRATRDKETSEAELVK